MELLLVLLTAHWVADFVLQSDWMALGKSKRFLPLFVHVGIYSVAMTIAWTLWTGQPPVAFLAVTFGTHFATDYVTSRVNSRLWAAKQNHWFFVSVGFDQLIHVWTLALTAQWLVR